MKHARIPYMLVLRYYGWRLFIVSLIWFIYDVRQLSCFHELMKSY